MVKKKNKTNQTYLQNGGWDLLSVLLLFLKQIAALTVLRKDNQAVLCCNPVTVLIFFVESCKIKDEKVIRKPTLGG